MGEYCAENPLLAGDNVDLSKATKKRMMLGEVYVHKARKLDSDASKEDQFDVFHIYEFDDLDSTTKIVPKLSTNCTEPQKIISVLENSTGSDTPQLQRLIDRLRAQSKWFLFILFFFHAKFNLVLMHF